VGRQSTLAEECPPEFDIDTVHLAAHAQQGIFQALPQSEQGVHLAPMAPQHDRLAVDDPSGEGTPPDPTPGPRPLVAQGVIVATMVSTASREASSPT